MKTAKQTVIEILKISHEARNSDMQMMLIYMILNGIFFTQEQKEIFRNLPFDFETLRRTRQVLQNDEKQLQATSGVKLKRMKKEARIREARAKHEWIFDPNSQSYKEI